MLSSDTVVGGRYRLGEIIGRGGGADVFRSEDLETGRTVAVKVLRSATPNDLKRFELEAETLARLDHPSIVRMCDRGTHDDVPYLVLDLIDGEPLSTRLQHGPLPIDEVAAIGAVLADALAHAHSLGVVHRDVKPGNVLFDQDGVVHLTDFGIARLTDVTSITSTGLVIGTPAYLAPEQVEGRPAAPAADVYALGLVLIEAITGVREYEGPPSEAALARLSRQPEIPPQATGSFGAVLAAMTSVDPTVRPSAASAAIAMTVSADTAPQSDATTVLAIGSDATTAIPVATLAAAHPPGAAPPRSRRGALLTLVVAAIAVLIIAVGIASGGGDNGVPPADADTSTTPTTPTTIATTTTVPPTTTTDAPRRGKGKKDDD